MSEFQQLNHDFEDQYEKHLQTVGMEPETDQQEAFLAEERADRQREHGPAQGSAGPPLPGRRFPADELAAQAALRPHTGHVEVGPHTPRRAA